MCIIYVLKSRNVTWVSSLPLPLVESLRKRFASAAGTQKNVRAQGGAPQTWGGQANQVMKSLVMGGFFKLPNKRTKDEVVRAFEAKGISTEGKKGNIVGILTRRVNKGTLRSAKGSNGLVY